MCCPLMRDLCMARYFLHLVALTKILDPKGVEMSADAVVSAALKPARDRMAKDVKHGRLDLHCRIDVQDDNDKIVHTLPFAESVEIVPPR
jgi:hypothetical protein